MAEGANNNGEPSEEEIDLLERSKKRDKDQRSVGDAGNVKRRSYRDSVLESGRRKTLMGEDIDEGEISDDDIIEESTDRTWIGIRMTKEEKINARRS